jgi:hypothetical protein
MNYYKLFITVEGVEVFALEEFKPDSTVYEVK